MKRLMRLSLLLAALGIMALPSGAPAATCDATQCTFEVSYVEPSTYADGSPMTTLTETTIYYGTTLLTQTKKVPASRPAGGGTITTTISLPLAVGMTKMTAQAAVSASISNGPEGPRSTTVSATVNFVGAPTGLTIR